MNCSPWFRYLTTAVHKTTATPRPRLCGARSRTYPCDAQWSVAGVAGLKFRSSARTVSLEADERFGDYRWSNLPYNSLLPNARSRSASCFGASVLQATRKNRSLRNRIRCWIADLPSVRPCISGTAPPCLQTYSADMKQMGVVN
jgi:hypothetical protein